MFCQELFVSFKHFNSHPRGDENLSQLIKRNKVTQFQLTPARGRRRVVWRIEVIGIVVSIRLARDTGVEDPYMKEASGFLDRLKARTPGLSADLPTQYSWLTGEARTFGDYSLVNFVPYKESTDDQIHAELLSYGAKLGGPSRTQNGVRLSDEQYSRLCELHGTLKIGGLTLMQALEREARSAAYQRVPEGDARMKELNSVIGKYRMEARNRLKREFPELAPKSAWRYNQSNTAEADLQKLIRYGQS